MKSRILTVGHSSGDAEELAVMLAGLGVDVIVDVRSQPSSRHAPQFNREPLSQVLNDFGIRYLHMGDALGGRPQGPGMYDKDGRVQYARVAQLPSFQTGIQRLIHGSQRHHLAIMCGEEDPTDCHRRLLIGRVLRDFGVRIDHVRSGGMVQTEEEVAATERVNHPERYQQTLFGEEVEAWKSIQSVSGATQRRSSSRS